MRKPKYLTTAQAASRLGVDRSTVGKYARRGLVVKRATHRQAAVRIKLDSWWINNDGRIHRGITATAVRRFNAQRGAR